jgi:hypothetical protein
MSKSKRKHAPKAVLRLPDLEQSKSAVLNSLASQSSHRSYDHATREFIEWYCSEPRLAFNETVVTRYRIFLEQAHYVSSTINLRLAAVRRLAYEAADAGLLSPDLAAGIRRVKGAKKSGVRIGNWLTAEQGKRLLGVFDRQSLRGKEVVRADQRARCSDGVTHLEQARQSVSHRRVEIDLEQHRDSNQGDVERLAGDIVRLERKDQY